MDSLHQGAALDCYPGVCYEGQGHCYLKEKLSVRSITSVCFGLLTPNLVYATNATKITASFFSSLPSFISYFCHINTWLNHWKPGFVALRRFLLIFRNGRSGVMFIVKRHFHTCKVLQTELSKGCISNLWSGYDSIMFALATPFWAHILQSRIKQPHLWWKDCMQDINTNLDTKCSFKKRIRDENIAARIPDAEVKITVIKYTMCINYTHK